MVKYLLGIVFTLALLPALVVAAEHPIGQGIEKNGMAISAVYLQPVFMQPTLPAATKTPSVHLEADIHALKNNANGFAVGEWIPYLQVTYHLQKKGSDWQTTGVLMPMIANDGPHYGANIELAGVGKYTLRYHINPPAYVGFARHRDKETGVAAWWRPFDLKWDFAYLGVGKKGGY